MTQRSRNKPDWQIRIAKERIDILFAEAAKTKEHALQNRYVELARKIGMRYNVKLPWKYKRRYCNHCHSYFGNESRRRLKDGLLIVTCRKCKRANRVPYK